ncbi:MAG: RluA family pseudouridine synthase, partial [Chloroflexota bacterium]|nr:RluA family pseudouridine synthase [Chloroflexota bacterium]
MPYSGTKEFVVEAGGPRLDVYLAQQCQISRAYVQKLIGEGQVILNGRQAKASQKLAPGDRVIITIPPAADVSLAAEPLPLAVVYEDSDLLVIDKPPGLTVHPAPGHFSHTLVNALLAHCGDLAGINGTLRPGIVHRLDKDTSGRMVVAKNDKAQQSLSQQIKERSVTKVYLALVVGHLSPERGAIEAPLGRDPQNRKRMAVVASGREARTEYRVLRFVDGFSLVEVTLITGRTHQIRVHFAAIGYPVAGDHIYGRRVPFLERQFLHAHRLGFRLPSSGEYREFVSP